MMQAAVLVADTVIWVGPSQTSVMDTLADGQTVVKERMSIWVAKFTGGAGGVGVGVEANKICPVETNRPCHSVKFRITVGPV